MSLLRPCQSLQKRLCSSSPWAVTSSHSRVAWLHSSVRHSIRLDGGTAVGDCPGRPAQAHLHLKHYSTASAAVSQPKPIALSSFSAAERTVYIQWGSSPSSTTNGYPAIYLRDNCTCDTCLHGSSGIRAREMVMWEPSVVENMTAIESVEVLPDGCLQVKWGDGHVSVFSADWLHCHRLSSGSEKRSESRFILPARKQWAAAEFPRDTHFTLDSLLNDASRLQEFLLDMYRHGVALVRECGTEHGSVAALANRVALLRETVFGPTWQIRVIPKANSMAYTTYEAPMHIDLPYLQTPPGILMLHCLGQAPSGGYTYCSDGFLIAETLRREDPETFRLLSDVAVTWATRGLDKQSDIEYNFEYDSPIIDLDRNGQVKALRLNQVRSSFLQLDADRVPRFYDAVRTLSRMACSAEYRAAVRLEPGEMILIDNHRMLHGRSELDAAGAAVRCLSGGYMDWDLVISRVRQLTAALRQQ